MYSGDFLETIKELHHNRGVPWTEIARALPVSRQLLYDLIKNRKRITAKVFKRAEIALPELLLRNPRLKRTRDPRLRRLKVYFLEDTEDAVMDPASTPAQEDEERYRLWRERSRANSKPVYDRDIRLRIKEEKERQARERDKVWLERLRSVWWGRK